MGTYAIINLATGMVENTTAWDGISDWSPGDGYIAVETYEASTGWSYADGIFSPPPELEPEPISDEQAGFIARQQRETLLRGTYDPGIMMALRALRMASTPEGIAYAEGKVSELDIYAEALVNIPSQDGFPQNIVWPIAPTK